MVREKAMRGASLNPSETIMVVYYPVRGRRKLLVYYPHGQNDEIKMRSST